MSAIPQSLQADPEIQRLAAIMRTTAKNVGGQLMAPNRGTPQYAAYINAQNALWDYTEKHWQQLGLPGNRWTINPISGELYEHESAKKTALRIGVTGASMAAGAYGLGALLTPAASTVAAAGTGGAAAGGAGAAGAAGTAATVGREGFFSSLGKFLSSPGGQVLTNTAGQLIGTGMQARAQSQATDAQSEALREALAFEKDVYNRAMADYEPYRTAGAASLSRLSDLASRPATDVTAANTFGAGQLPNAPVPSARSGPPPTSQAGLVPMRAPDGELRMVRPDAVAKYTQRGARLA